MSLAASACEATSSMRLSASQALPKLPSQTKTAVSILCSSSKVCCSDPLCHRSCPDPAARDACQHDVRAACTHVLRQSPSKGIGCTWCLCWCVTMIYLCLENLCSSHAISEVKECCTPAVTGLNTCLTEG